MTENLSVERNRRAAMARNRALAALAVLFPEDFEQLHVKEREKLGLTTQVVRRPKPHP